MVAAASAGAALVSGCRSHPNRPAQASYVGSDACAPCHAAEYNKQHASRHARTLHYLDRKSLAALAPPAGHIPGTVIALELKGDRYRLTVPDDPASDVDLDLAFGSGKTGVTYVALLPTGEIMEMRKSYFPALHRWILTPGHPKDRTELIGLLNTHSQSLRCLSCHSAKPATDLTLDDRFFGVGCEACHGPGSAHIDAVKAGNTAAPHIVRWSDLSATDVNLGCAACHRSKQNVDSRGTGASAMTQRFQPYGLMESRCFKESNGALSCLTCHDPHADATADVRTYESVCLSCHAPGGAPAASGSGPAAGKPCPVNPRSGCVRCHMPSRLLMSGLPIRMADHRIAAHPDLR